MPPVKPLSRIAEKWARVAKASQQEYAEGVQHPRADWAERTLAANDSYKTALQQAISEDRFAQGVDKAGTQKWQENAIKKGPQRWAQGINLATNYYEKGFAPYRQVIESIQLPPRGPKGDPNNIQRVAIIAQALHEEKQRLRGGR